MNKRTLIPAEFKPATFFLLRFTGLYLAGNLLYGLYVTAWLPAADPATREVTTQSAQVLNWFYSSVHIYLNPAKPTAFLLLNNRPVVSVYEGCNGLNVSIVFITFLLAYGPVSRKLLWFIPLGLLIIHLSNLLRITLLFAISLNLPDYLYFTHKYLFTAFIFLVVFLLWAIWVFRLSKR